MKKIQGEEEKGRKQGGAMVQNSLILGRTKITLSHELGGEWTSERENEWVSVAEGASEVSSAEQAKEWAVRPSGPMQYLSPDSSLI